MTTAVGAELSENSSIIQAAFRTVGNTVAVPRNRGDLKPTESTMTKTNEAVEQLIDLGDVTVETMGGAPFQAPDGVISQFNDMPGLSND